MQVRESVANDFEAILATINGAAQAYRGVIPSDRWHEPYMSTDELAKEIANGVIFWIAEDSGQLLGVMGIQDKGDVALVRHAYTATTLQRKGVGTKLLRHVEALAGKPILIGTWADASWAIEFYRRNGFTVVSDRDKNRLLRAYWSIPARQVDTSVVLADSRWMNAKGSLDCAQPIVAAAYCLKKGDSMSAIQKAGVVQFYDTHPINEDEILAKLSARGTNLEALSEDELKDFDQDHYGGVDVVGVLADKAGIRPEHHVLDVCSGMGGPARWIAYRYGCRVTGLDFTESRVEAAKRLTERVRLDHIVDFVHGDATAMPLPDARYDVVLGQESWLHIPDKAALIQQCARVAKPAGTIAFTDIVLKAQLTRGEEDRLTAEMHSPQVASADRYEQLLANNGYRVKAQDDLSESWKRILVDRLAMYRSLRDTTIAKFGEARFLEYDRAYSHFVGLFVSGKLGGVRIVARHEA